MKILEEHICKENALHGTAAENKVYRDADGWGLSLDCGCCHAEIQFCPFCGVRLGGE